MDIAGNLELIQRLQPATTRLVMLSDRTTFGRRMAARAREIQAERVAANERANARGEEQRGGGLCSNSGTISRSGSCANGWPLHLRIRFS